MKKLDKNFKLRKDDVDFAKSIDDDYREDCFRLDENELYYLTGNDYPTRIRGVMTDITSELRKINNRLEGIAERNNYTLEASEDEVELLQYILDNIFIR